MVNFEHSRLSKNLEICLSGIVYQITDMFLPVNTNQSWSPGNFRPCQLCYRGCGPLTSSKHEVVEARAAVEHP